MHRGIRATVMLGGGDGQVRLRWEAWHDGEWELLAVQAEVGDVAGLLHLPAAVADVLRHWLRGGDHELILMQEQDLP
jgi:hypothetical protein